MNLSAWNIKSQKDPSNHGIVKCHVQLNKINVMALLETRVRLGNEGKFSSQWRGWSVEWNKDLIMNEWICVMWKFATNLCIIKNADQLIHSSAIILDFSIVYITFLCY